MEEKGKFAAHPKVDTFRDGVAALYRIAVLQEKNTWLATKIGDDSKEGAESVDIHDVHQMDFEALQ